MDAEKSHPGSVGSLQIDSQQTSVTQLDDGINESPQQFAELVHALSRRSTRASDSDDPFDTDYPAWTLEKTLRAVLKRSSDEDVAPISPSTSVRWRNVEVHGEGAVTTSQSDVLSVFLDLFRAVSGILGKGPQREILHGINGLVKEGEMLLVLGRPGSGCSTLLKTLAGLTEGYSHWAGDITYSGVPIDIVKERFRGKVVYNAEVENHFPYLTVAQTLEFALKTKTPKQRIGHLSRDEYIEKMRNILGATFGLRHTFNTRVGNDFVRGVSGGERKRVSIAEMLATRASVTYWDNPTRGLDSSTSLEFARALRVATNLTGHVAVTALYQPGDSLVEIYDKVTILYAGHQIWFGDLSDAKRFFQDMGFLCGPRETTAEFLTSITDPVARQVRSGFEERVPRTPEEFVSRWKESVYYQRLMAEIEEHEKQYPRGCSDALQNFKSAQAAEKTSWTRSRSPYMLNLGRQFMATYIRAYQRILGDKAYTLSIVVTMAVVALVIGSMFYDIPEDTSGFFSKGGAIFFSVLFNILVNFAEISAQFSQRPIVEKHKSYAMYHPFIDALASMVVQYPIKLLNVGVFSVIIYFLANFKREPGPFFLFVLFTFLVSVMMSALFRTIAALANRAETALATAGVLLLLLGIYAGYIIPRPSMHPWFKWISYLNPIYYAIEALMVVEFHGRNALCNTLVPSGPGYEHTSVLNQVCAVTGARPGQLYVSGDDYVELSFSYSYSHLWRNLGICIAFFVFFVATYAAATEFKNPPASKGDSLVFHHPRLPSAKRVPKEDDVEDRANEFVAVGQQQEALMDAVARGEKVFTWKHVNYDIELKGETRRLLSDVQGYVKPGTLTALMGESGAGKTTLLNVLAQRISVGVITGNMLVNGSPLGRSFQQETGYVQQQDIHLAESTVREALRFSALLRQPKEVPVQEKYDYVEKIIAALGMQEYADAVIGVPGQGLNVEQRKRTTIGLELVAKPTLLLFLDEPTSGLDSQSAWSIVKFLRDMANAGQAILCTIHQPSSMLFEQFDRLLLLAKGGKTVYFGDIGPNASTVIQYFERNGAPSCPENANPAEYILDTIGAGATAHEERDWAEVWKSSPEFQHVSVEIEKLNSTHQEGSPAGENTDTADTSSGYAMPWLHQYLAVQRRLFQQYWRSPVYIWSKVFINLAGGLFLGFTFYKEPNSVAGLQNKTFSVFMLLLLSLVIIVQLQPRLIQYRELYEVRERHSKMYHWTVFVVGSIVAEIPFNIIIASVCFICWYFPIGWWRDISDGRGASMWFVFMLYQLYHTSFSQSLAIVAPDAETAAMLTILFYTFILAFTGVVQPLSQLVGFWHFAYYVSPFTYLVSSLMSTATHGVPVRCAEPEINIFNPPAGMTCGEYAGVFAREALASIYNPDATANCQFCRYAVSDAYLAGVNMFYEDRWRDFGYLCAFTVFNTVLFFAVYWLRSRGVGSRIWVNVSRVLPVEKVKQVLHRKPDWKV